ncbi:MAG: hypothetical protein AAF628_31985 [Planctomycetota bacterium]
MNMELELHEQFLRIRIKQLEVENQRLRRAVREAEEKKALADAGVEQAG